MYRVSMILDIGLGKNNNTLVHVIIFKPYGRMISLAVGEVLFTL